MSDEQDKPVVRSPEELYQMALNVAAKQYRENPKYEHPPVILAQQRSGDIILLHVGAMMADATRGRVFKMMQTLAAKPDVACVCFASEAWKAEAREEFKHLTPSESPNRIEVLMLNVMNATRQAIMYCRIIRQTDATELERLPFKWLHEDRNLRTMGGRAVRPTRKTNCPPGGKS